MKNNTAKKLLTYILAAMSVSAILVAFSSCKDGISLPESAAAPKIVVYSFPCPSQDTTYIFVSRSLPVRKYRNNTLLQAIDSARVTYTVNGRPQTVVNRGDGYYYVLAEQRAGDKISVTVSADGLADATAQTTIPDTVAIGGIGFREVKVYDDDYSDMEDYDQFTATFTDPADTRDYYAVRVMEIRKQDFPVFDENNSQIGDSTALVRYYPDIDTKSEPLLKPMTNIDTSFGFDNYFYGGLAIFDDGELGPQPYTLHLNVKPSWNAMPWCRVELLHLSPEYYYFLQSINAVESNDMAKYGLSQIMPTATNVSGGFGLVAGWNVAVTDTISRNYQ